jgi:NAD(P)-dependent dehydrogenase (short-subunit alcohol dehydrogenase family)
MQLNDRVVVVTGGSRGLGREMANGLTAAGGRIVLACPLKSGPPGSTAYEALKRLGLVVHI